MLREIELINYRNHKESSFQFTRPFVLVNGPNGSGKTNLLDAIYFLCITKSYFQRSDLPLMRHQSAFFRLKGIFTIDKADIPVQSIVEVGKKKIFSFDGVPYEKLSEHVGRLPVAMITPDDTRLIQQYPEERRRFMDASLSQNHPDYLHHLQSCLRLIVQKNALLKSWDMRYGNNGVLDAINQQLELPMTAVYSSRKEFVAQLQPVVQRIYARLSGGKEVPELEYQSDLANNDWPTILQLHAGEEQRAGRTLVGIHRDDLVLSFDGHPVKQVGSQGQIKTLLLAMKLAAMELLSTTGAIEPILLLDDIMEKLDRNRMNALLALLAEGNYGQVFITDADAARSENVLRASGLPFDQILMEGRVERLSGNA